MSDYIFLHYGPGGNAEIERRLLKDLGEKIEFWDQPTTESFNNLVDACVEKLREKFSTEKEVRIIAHSFGCNLACFALERLGWRAKELIFLSPVDDLYFAFANLASCLAKRSTDSQVANKLSSASKNLIQFKSLNDFWPCIGLIAAHPEFMQCYWSSDEAFKEYSSVSANSKPLNFEVWQKILNDYLSKHLRLPAVRAERFEVVVGEKDPYWNSKSQVRILKEHYPLADIRVLENVGHFAQFESDVLGSII